MKDLVYKYKEFLIGLLLTIGLLWPLVWAPYFKHHDDVQVIRLYEMDKCFKDGQIPCRWVPDLGGLYGYPLFNYYAPLPYYFGEIIFLLTKNLIFSVKVMFAAAFLGSYIFMFLLGQKFWGKLGGSLSAIFYSFAPYHALDFYIRGAMGELWALMFFPAIFWALTRLKENINILNMLCSGIFISLLLLSHNLSAMLFLPIIIFWIFLLFLKDKEIKFVYFSFLSLILGFLLSAFYIIPMLIEKKLVHVDTTTYGYFGYTEHFKGIRELFIDRSWGYGSSIREVPGGEKEHVSFQIGWMHILGWILSIFAIKYFLKSNPWVAKVILACSLVSIFAIFMVHPRSEFIWRFFDPLKYLQFPWRFLLITIFFLSFLTGAIFIALKNKGWSNQLGIWFIVLVVSLNFLYFKPEKFLEVSDRELLMGENWDKQIKRSIFDYLPIFAKEPPAELAKDRYEILTGDTKVTSYEQGSNWFKFQTETKTHTIIRISQYYFPEWKIFIDGKEAIFEYKNNSLGLMTIILGEGNHIVEGRLFDTPIRSISNAITLVSFALLLVLLTTQSKKIREWIKYYRKAIN